MPVAATRLARKAVGGRPIPPWLIVVGGETLLTVESLRVVQTLAECLQLRPATTSMPIASTPAARSNASETVS